MSLLFLSFGLLGCSLLNTQNLEPRSVTYNGNGNDRGEPPTDAGDYFRGDVVTVSGNTGGLGRDGYLFEGWNTRATGNGTAYNAGDILVVGGTDITLYAQWTSEPVYSLTYDGNGSDGGSIPSDANAYVEGDTVTVAAPGAMTRAGYTFFGWNTEANGDGTAYSTAATFSMPANDLELYAQWTETGDDAPVVTGVSTDVSELENGGTITVTVTSTSQEPVTWLNRRFNGPNGNIHGGGSTTNFTEIAADTWEFSWTETISEFAPSGDYVFSGISVQTDSQLRSADWPHDLVVTVMNSYVGSEPTVTDVSVSASQINQGDSFTVTVTASSSSPVDWLNYSFDGPDGNIHGGGGSRNFTEIATDIWEHSWEQTISDTATPGEYTFSSVSVENEAALQSAIWPNDTVLMVVQMSPTYSVSYDGNGSDGGSVPTDDTEYQSGDPITVAQPGTMSRSGYTFSGWNTADDGTGTSQAAGSSLTIGSADVTLYAQWTSEPVYSVSYDGNGSDGGSVPTDDTEYQSGDPITVAQPGTMSRSGYTFGGWNTDPDGDGTLYFGGSSFNMPSENVTLYAQWSTISVTGVSLNTNDFTMEEGQSYSFSATVQPSGATNKNVSWSSSNTAVAFVDSSGSILTQSAGETTITVTTDDGDYSDSATLSVLAVPIDVSGIVNSNTTWSTGNRYRLTGTVQIAHGSTLTIQPGVEVLGQGKELQVFGHLTVAGTSASRVVLDNVQTELRGTTSAYASIDISFAEIKTGAVMPATGNAIYGSMNLSDSVIRNTSYMYVWYPVANTTIERNIFINTGGVSVGTKGSVIVGIRNNVFSGSSGDNGEIYSVENWASNNTSETIVEHNTFLDTDRIALRLPSGYTGAAMTAANNYWSTTNTATIESMIFDNNDDLQSADSIPYSPYLSAPHADTPDATPYLQ